MEAMETILPWNHRRPLWINPSNQPPKTLTMNHTILSFHSIQFNSIEINQLFHEIKIQPNEIEMFGKMIHFIQWNRKEWSRVDCEGV